MCADSADSGFPTAAFAAVPPGAYLVAASGGADSTALVRLATADPRLKIVLGHLNHELRGTESDGDEAFVRELAKQLRVPAEVARLSNRPVGAIANASARYRAARLDFFGEIIARHRLRGVLLAHHADDQAEGVLLRILRGAALPSLGGMKPASRVDGVNCYRPLLGVRCDALRDYLRSIDQPWREDSSNALPAYRRNVVRQLLAKRPAMTGALLRVADTARAWRAALDERSPCLAESFECQSLAVPGPIAEYAAGRWLIERGAPADAVSPSVRRRLVDQALNPAAPLRQHYPGKILVRRRKNRIDAMASAPLQSGQPHGQDQAAAAGEL